MSNPWGFLNEQEEEKKKNSWDFLNASSAQPRLIRTEGGMDIWELPSGNTFSRRRGQGPGTPWDKLDYNTRLNDLRSLSIWGQQGTSEGDRWSPDLIEAARGIVGKSPDVTREHIIKFAQHMRQTGNMSYMAPHPGKKAYTKEYFKGKAEKEPTWEDVDRILAEKERKFKLPIKKPLEAISAGLAGMTYFPISRTAENVISATQGESPPLKGWLKDILPVPFMGRRTWGSDVLEKAGVKSGPIKTIAGLGLDIFADPLTYVGGGLSKAGRLSKLEHLAVPGSKVAKGIEKLKAAGKYAPLGKTTEEQLRLGQRGMRWAGKPVAPKLQAKVHKFIEPGLEELRSSRMASTLSTKAGPQEVRAVRDIITAEKHAYPEIIEKIRKGAHEKEAVIQTLAKKHGLPADDVKRVLTHMSEAKAPPGSPAFLGISGGIEETFDPTKLGSLLDDVEAKQFAREFKESMTGIAKTELESKVLKSTLGTEQIDYVMHLTTPEARAAMRKANKKNVFRKIIDMVHPSTKHRVTFMPTDPNDLELVGKLKSMAWKDKIQLVEEGRLKFPSIGEINQLAREGNLIPGVEISQFLYEDPGKIAAIRQLRSEKSLMSARILENSRDIGMKEGWVIPYKKGDMLEPGWDIVKSPLTQDVAFKSDVADVLNGTYQVLNDTKQMSYLVGAYKKSLQWWKIWTLMPFPSYHFRNVFGGNLFNQMLAGMNPVTEGWWNPKGANALAAKVQRVNVWKNKGIPIEQWGKKAKSWSGEAIATDTGLKYSLDQVDEFAKQAGIYRAGQFTADIFQDLPQFVKETKKTLNPLRTHNLFTDTGMKVGSALEDNAKLGTFIHFLKQGYSPGEAGQLAHKFIFDYFDIPKSVEKAKNFTPFITWYYKNIPLQIEHMAKKPRVFSSIYKAKAEITGTKEPRSDVMTEYYHDSYPVVFQKKGDKARWAGLARWLPITDVNILTDPKEWGSMVWPGIKAPVETMFNKELYFGRPIHEKGRRTQMLGTYMDDRLAYLLKQHRLPSTIDRLNPFNIWGTEKKKGLFGLGQKRGGKWEMPQGARWARELTGLRTYETNVKEATERKTNELQREKARLRSRMRWQVDDKEKNRIKEDIIKINDQLRELKRYKY